MRDSDSRKKRIRCRLVSLGGLGLLALVTLGVLSVCVRHRNPPEARVAPPQVRQQAAVTPGVGTPNDPIAKKVETAADGGDAEPPAQTATDIDLPAPSIDDQNVNLMLARLSTEQYWKAEDKVARSWPKLDDLRERLVRELRAEFDLEKMTARELVQRAVDLRERFWQAGGRMSPNSFTDLYRARVLLELGHQRYPDDLMLTDELVETIQSGWPYLTYGGSAPRAFVSVDKSGKPLQPGSVMGFDLTTMRDILEMREKQFELRQRQLEGNRPPEFQDFLRLYDLGILCHYTLRVQREANTARADQILKWLLDNAEPGGWAYYRAHLERLRESWTNGKDYAFTILMPRNRQAEPAGQYARRLPSFRGAQGRGLIAVKDLPRGTNMIHVRTRPGGDGTVEIVEQ